METTNWKQIEKKSGQFWCFTGMQLCTLIIPDTGPLALPTEMVHFTVYINYIDVLLCRRKVVPISKLGICNYAPEIYIFADNLAC